MEDKSSEKELIECRKQLKEANEKIEVLEMKIVQNKKQHEWEMRKAREKKEELEAHNADLYDRETKSLIYADDLEKENIALKKEKKKLEIKIEKLEKENEKLLKKMDESTRGANWERLGKAGM